MMDAHANEKPQALLSALREAGVRFVAVLPESWLSPLDRLLRDDEAVCRIAISREEEGVGICAGLALGGRPAALLMQNTGLLACANAIVTLPLKHRIPLLMLVVNRGGPGQRDDLDYHLLEGEVTEPFLAALRIPVFHVRAAGEAGRIRDAAERAALGRQPVVVLLWHDALRL